ncbi:MRPS17 37S ribosomal protein S17 [Candida maltosa Xu316]|uniref:Mitochondrial ribosomal protein, small subunit, putative n=1 Tax=Candida maltosa (strain Xu316) TaxID=1245528 RepID=M3HJI0_CANMX|nr:Mitochondrial ribosomal protein, small subunit, putative [Candida maltosa Xu316]
MARQNFIGVVISQGKMNKTVKVRVQGKVYDKRIDKEVLTRKDFLVHDEGNIVKEGDVVRIESIPKRSKRKAFAIAEIKLNKGQQFAAYEDMAKKQVRLEDETEARNFIENRNKFSNIITKLEDLKRMDELTYEITNSTEADHSKLIDEIKAIKEKYNITSWPTTEPVVDFELNKPIYTTEQEKRLYFIDKIMNQLMTDPKYEEWKLSILQKKVKKPLDQVSSNIQKNILRKFVLNVENECPIPLPE